MAKEEEKNTPKRKSLLQREAFLAVKKISNQDSPWIMTQELLQEIEASFTIANPDSKHEVPKLVIALKKEIEHRYEEDEDTKNLLLDSIPSDRSIRVWRKKEGWENSVWDLIRDTGLFTAAKRAEMIDSIFKRGIDKSDNAAKMYLTMSGDYSDKVEVTNNALDRFREINKILHAKKRTDSE